MCYFISNEVRRDSPGQIEVEECPVARNELSRRRKKEPAMVTSETRVLRRAYSNRWRVSKFEIILLGYCMFLQLGVVFEFDHIGFDRSSLVAGY
jgi:hypothetical protein